MAGLWGAGGGAHVEVGRHRHRVVAAVQGRLVEPQHVAQRRDVVVGGLLDHERDDAQVEDLAVLLPKPNPHRSGGMLVLVATGL
jgi:hypothetical protein